MMMMHDADVDRTLFARVAQVELLVFCVVEALIQIYGVLRGSSLKPGYYYFIQVSSVFKGVRRLLPHFRLFLTGDYSLSNTPNSRDFEENFVSDTPNSRESKVILYQF